MLGRFDLAAEGARVKRPSTAPSTDSSDAWIWAARLLERWEIQDDRVDWLLETLPANLPTGARARVQALLVGTVRHLGRIDQTLSDLVKRSPRPSVLAGLRLAGFELIESQGDPGLSAKVGHHLVEKIKILASAKEAGFANAVVRRLTTILTQPLAKPGDADPVSVWAQFYSHPEWLIVRWREQLGDEATRSLMAFNQIPAPVVVRWRNAENVDEASDWLQKIEDHSDFYTVEPGHGPELRELITTGLIHVQDAATRLAVDLLDPQSGETVLDLCAAPGGKSLAMADRMGQGKVVAFDLPGRRLPRLRENLDRASDEVETVVVAGDLCRGGSRALAAANEPTEYEAVLLDVPCSNTGVMRHRVDVKWRLQESSFRRHALQQLDLLLAAAERVTPGGRLVYSTCSIDREENEQVVNAFLQRSRGEFELETQKISLPWETNHDGAGAFRFRRQSSD